MNEGTYSVFEGETKFAPKLLKTAPHGQYIVGTVDTIGGKVEVRSETRKALV